MYQIKIIMHKSTDTVQAKVNDWLRDNANVPLVSIDVKFTSSFTYAIIVYRA